MGLRDFVNDRRLREWLQAQSPFPMWRVADDGEICPINQPATHIPNEVTASLVRDILRRDKAASPREGVEVLPIPDEPRGGFVVIQRRASPDLSRALGAARARWNLSGREVEVVEQLLEGHDAAGIARALGITANTARKHRQNILDKMDCDKVTQALRKVWELG